MEEPMCLSETLAAAHAQPAAAADVPHPRPRPGTVSRRGLLAGAGGAALALAAPAPALAGGRKHDRGRVRDLSHVFRAGFPMYVGDPPRRRTVFDFDPNGFYAQAWEFAEHAGTHMDAPGHFTPGGRLTPELDPEELFAPVAVIDIARRVAADPDAQVEVADLRAYERHHGRIPRHAAVFMHSGWERRVGDPDAYRNPGPDGTFHFPGFGLEAVEWLLERRHIRAIGVDTLSLDIGASTTFAVHSRLLGADRYGLENLANTSRIPPRGAEAIVGVVPWEQGSGGPCRVLARW
jgi:kynurenine formamidase